MIRLFKVLTVTILCWSFKQKATFIISLVLLFHFFLLLAANAFAFQTFFSRHLVKLLLNICRTLLTTMEGSAAVVLHRKWWQNWITWFNLHTRPTRVSPVTYSISHFGSTASDALVRVTFWRVVRWFGFMVTMKSLNKINGFINPLFPIPNTVRTRCIHPTNNKDAHSLWSRHPTTHKPIEKS